MTPIKFLQTLFTGLLIANATLTTSAGQSAASRVDFSGKWTFVMNDGQPLSPLSSPLGQEGVISQDSSSITFRQTSPPAFDPNRTLIYRLDGFVSVEFGRLPNLRITETRAGR
jgi:hypothetical protein